jgi:hypothetical protein
MMRKIGPIGPRVLKTGLAVTLTVFLIRLILGKYEVYGALAAVLAVAPTAGHSVKYAIQLIIANILGGLIGTAAILTFGPNPIVMGAVVVLILLICNAMKWRNVTSSALTVTMFVMGPHTEPVYTYAAGRFVAVVIGSLAGTGVNALVFRPEYRRSTLAAIHRAGARLDAFILTVAGRLDLPQSLSKAEVKATAAGVEEYLAEARKALGLHAESGLRAGDAAERALLERAIQLIATFLERIQIIHKAALAAESAADYPVELPVIQAALRSLVSDRQALFARLTDPQPASPAVIASLQAVEQRFEHAMAALPQQPGEAEAYFRLYRMRNSVAYMAHRLDRMAVALAAAAPVSEAQTVVTGNTSDA